MADIQIKERVGGAFHRDFCSARHPTNPDVYCRRLENHPADVHRAFEFRIFDPDEWEVEHEL